LHSIEELLVRKLNGIFVHSSTFTKGTIIICPLRIILRRIPDIFSTAESRAPVRSEPSVGCWKSLVTNTPNVLVEF